MSHSSNARAEIDRHYLIGDALSRAGEALGMFLLCLLGLTGLRLEHVSDATRAPLIIIFSLAAIGSVALAISGRRMRKSATALDRKG